MIKYLSCRFLALCVVRGKARESGEKKSKTFPQCCICVCCNFLSFFLCLASKRLINWNKSVFWLINASFLLFFYLFLSAFSFDSFNWLLMLRPLIKFDHVSFCIEIWLIFLPLCWILSIAIKFLLTFFHYTPLSLVSLFFSRLVSI